MAGMVRVRPFVTISRQPGAGGRFGNLLAERLGELEMLRGARKTASWRCMDRELVERVARDHHMSARLIDALEESSHSYVMEFLRGLRLRDGGPPSDLGVVRRMAETMRGLAHAGHVILVGLGGVFMTRNMPGGIHVRLVAPRDFRVRNIARMDGISRTAARERVHHLDEQRIGYYRSFWPNDLLSDELFHLTMNSSVMTEPQMANCVVELVKPLLERGA
jgi:cytidylate kinase